VKCEQERVLIDHAVRECEQPEKQVLGHVGVGLGHGSKVCFARAVSVFRSERGAIVSEKPAAMTGSQAESDSFKGVWWGKPRPRIESTGRASGHEGRLLRLKVSRTLGLCVT
jgi:hypothetical protein